MMTRNHYSVLNIIPTQMLLPDRIQKRLALLETEGQSIDWENLKTIGFKVIAHKDTKQNLSISSDISSDKEEHCA